MKNMSYLAAIMAFASTTLFAASQVTDPQTGFSFSDTITMENGGESYNLKATGVATRTKFFVKIYSIAHYLQDPPANDEGDIVAQIMNDANAKELTIQWARNVEGSKVQQGYYDAFKKNLSSADYKALEKEIKTFVNFLISNVAKGEKQHIRWFPGGIIQVTIEETVQGQIENPAFAAALWNVWFGPNSVVEKNRLTSLVK